MMHLKFSSLGVKFLHSQYTNTRCWYSLRDRIDAGFDNC